MVRPARYEELRSELMKRYEARWGVEWPRTPWGAAWPDVLREAEDVDRRYLRAFDALVQFADGLDALRAVVATREGDCAPGQVNSHGRTAPELVAFDVAGSAGPVLNELREHVLAELEGMRNFKPRAPDRIRDEDLAGFRERWPEETAFLEHSAVPARVFDGLRAAYAVHFTRLHKRDEDGLEITFLPDCVPPRTVGSTEWRRRYLVELLDTFPLRHSPAGKLVPPTASEIALVSLLAAGIEVLKAAEINEGVTSVVAAERKAIDLVRKRYTPFGARRTGRAMLQFLGAGDSEAGKGTPSKTSRGSRGKRRRGLRTRSG